MKLRRFEYLIREKDGSSFKGSYTIKENIEPLHYQDEKLVQEFEIDYE